MIMKIESAYPAPPQPPGALWSNQVWVDGCTPLPPPLYELPLPEPAAFPHLGWKYLSICRSWKIG